MWGAGEIDVNLDSFVLEGWKELVGHVVDELYQVSLVPGRSADGGSVETADDSQGVGYDRAVGDVSTV